MRSDKTRAQGAARLSAILGVSSRAKLALVHAREHVDKGGSQSVVLGIGAESIPRSGLAIAIAIDRAIVVGFSKALALVVAVVLPVGVAMDIALVLGAFLPVTTPFAVEDDAHSDFVKVESIFVTLGEGPGGRDSNEEEDWRKNCLHLCGFWPVVCGDDAC